MKTEKESQEGFMAEALDEARRAIAEGEVPVGCVIVKDGRILARGHNTVEGDGSTLRHAEINAIEKAQRLVGKLLDGCEIYVTVEPCAMCAGAIVGARAKKLFFGTREEKSGCCGSLYMLTDDDRLSHRVETHEGILGEECRALMQGFFADRR